MQEVSASRACQSRLWLHKPGSRMRMMRNSTIVAVRVDQCEAPRLGLKKLGSSKLAPSWLKIYDDVYTLSDRIFCLRSTKIRKLRLTDKAALPLKGKPYSTNSPLGKSYMSRLFASNFHRVASLHQYAIIKFFGIVPLSIWLSTTSASITFPIATRFGPAPHTHFVRHVLMILNVPQEPVTHSHTRFF